MLHFNSDHPDKTKKEVIKEYIRAKMKITWPICHKNTLQKLNRILKNNKYPVKYIQKRMKNVIQGTVKEEKQEVYYEMITEVVKNTEDRIPTKMERR